MREVAGLALLAGSFAELAVPFGQVHLAVEVDFGAAPVWKLGDAVGGDAVAAARGDVGVGG